MGGLGGYVYGFGGGLCGLGGYVCRFGDGGLSVDLVGGFVFALWGAQCIELGELAEGYLCGVGGGLCVELV